jgi:hypothetical protein
MGRVVERSGAGWGRLDHPGASVFPPGFPTRLGASHRATLPRRGGTILPELPPQSPAQSPREAVAAGQQESLHAQQLLPGDRNDLGLAPQEPANRKEQARITPLKIDKAPARLELGSQDHDQADDQGKQAKMARQQCPHDADEDEGPTQADQRRARQPTAQGFP